MNDPYFTILLLYGIILIGSLIMLVYVKTTKSTKSMTLQESIQKLKDISHQSSALYQRIHEEYLHDEENKKLFERWLNTRSEKLRQRILYEIEIDEKKWEQFLNLFPLPDKPFDINDVKDKEFKSCIQEIEKLEKEDYRLFSDILDTFDSDEDRKIIKEYLSLKFVKNKS